MSLVVGTGGAAVPLQLGDPLREWVFAADLEPYRRIGGRTIVERVIQTLERYTVTDAAREDYLASFEGDRFAESIRYVQSYPIELEALQVLPHSELHLIDFGHFIWEDAADEYAAAVSAWWAEGFEGPYARGQRTRCEQSVLNGGARVRSRSAT